MDYSDNELLEKFQLHQPVLSKDSDSFVFIDSTLRCSNGTICYSYSSVCNNFGGNGDRFRFIKLDGESIFRDLKSEVFTELGTLNEGLVRIARSYPRGVGKSYAARLLKDDLLKYNVTSHLVGHRHTRDSHDYWWSRYTHDTLGDKVRGIRFMNPHAIILDDCPNDFEISNEILTSPETMLTYRGGLIIVSIYTESNSQ